MFIACYPPPDVIYLLKCRSPVSVESSHQRKVILLFWWWRGGKGQEKSADSTLKKRFFEKLFYILMQMQACRWILLSASLPFYVVCCTCRVVFKVQHCL